MTRGADDGTRAIPGAPADLFSGGGELGERMRAFDWSRTPLGPVEQWPQSLKTCVRIVLTSRQPMFVWWGDALINLYNDAYKSIVGGKHPEALGQPASVVWREIWDAVAPRSESAMRLNEGTYDEALLLIMERHGYQEETYYTFSYSPVPGDEGGIGGLICANTDDTERIIGQRQLGLLGDLAAVAADTRTEEDACRRSAAALATNPRDLPFAAIYIVDAGARVARRQATAGITAAHTVAPAELPLDGPARWPLAAALRSHDTELVALDDSFGALPTGAWEQPPRQAALVPLPQSGQAGLAGALLVGLNPFRLFDDDYHAFLRLVAGQVAANVASAQAYQQEKQRAEALAAIDRAKTAFFSNVSHEFRTPLTLMLGPLEDALARPQPALTGGNLETAYRNALRLLRLVNSLLDFSRIEAGRAQARFAPEDLPALTAELAGVFRAAVERAGLELVVRCEALPETAYVDREMWEKVVLNLLSNAFKFTLEGRIEVTLRARGDRAELTVRDTGIGVPAAELPRLFERFHRVEGATGRTHEGSGIGLALVQELVRMHGGQIEADSREGVGTTFTVSLPLGRHHLPAEHVQDAPAVTAGNAAAAFVEEAARWLDVPLELSAPPADGRAYVLVADDNADMRDYVARILGQRWEVKVVANGRQALTSVRARRPDLVLSDVMMPELDGFGFLREVRSDPKLRSLPVIMLSARAGEDSRVEGLLAGADDYLVKPFAARELLARVSVHLEMGRLRARLEEQWARLDEIFREAPVAIAMLHGPELTFEVANPLYLHTVGGRPILGRPFLEALPEMAGQGYDEILAEVMRTGEPRQRREALVRLDRSGSGHLEDGYWTFVCTPLREEDGRCERVILICNEVTDQVESRRRLEALAAQAGEANRAKDEFLAMLGHELRNPLSPILTALQLLRMRGSEAGELAVIERQVGHLVRLVDDLLDVSRITRGRVELRRERLELATVVRRGVEMASPLLEQRHQQLDLDVPSPGLIVDGDPARLAQVVSNLLTNASKYSEPRTRILLSARRVAERVEMRVRDQGIGITPETLSRVFDMFVQHPQALDRSKGGLGLGLAIVRSLVEMHGGAVRAESEGPGCGSEFLVELPFAPGPVAAEDPEERPTPRVPAAAPAPRVLVVDDNRDAALTVAAGLEHLGYDVRIAHDGPSALEVARGFNPHVCLLDIGLPVMDGYELARRLRAGDGPPGPLRLIALTGYGQDTDRRRSLEAGFDAHAVKPVTLDALERMVTG